MNAKVAGEVWGSELQEKLLTKYGRFVWRDRVRIPRALAFTGHRPQDIPDERHKHVRARIAAVIHGLGPDVIISGMALGTDMQAAAYALQDGRRVIAAVPFEGQENVWPMREQTNYRQLLDHPNCDWFYTSPGGFSDAKFQKRNQWMVDWCQWLYPVWDGSVHGGTANCLRYAVRTRPGDILPGFDPRTNAPVSVRALEALR